MMPVPLLLHRAPAVPLNPDMTAAAWSAPGAKLSFFIPIAVFFAYWETRISILRRPMQLETICDFSELQNKLCRSEAMHKDLNLRGATIVASELRGAV